MPVRRWPAWRRRLALRRTAAGALFVVAVVLALRPGAPPPEGRIVVLRADAAPGATFGPADLEVRAVPLGSIPVGAVAEPADAVGRRPVGPVRAGEALTDVRLVGSEAAVAAVGTPDAAGVPVRLADPAVAGLLRPGTTVDVVGGAEPGRADLGAAGPAGTEGDPAAGSPLLAARAVVLDVLPAAERGGTGPVVVLALPGPVAARVAAATLGREVTVTLR